MELDPGIVIRRAIVLVHRHPETLPVVEELMQTYIEVLDSLTEDWERLESAS